MMKLSNLVLAALLVALSCVRPTSAIVIDPPTGNCWDSTEKIMVEDFKPLLNFTLRNTRRTYILCPMVYTIGDWEQNAAFPNPKTGDFPMLIFNPNVHLKCVTPGTCIFRGGSIQLMNLMHNSFLYTFLRQNNFPTQLPGYDGGDSSNLLVEGVTFLASSLRNSLDRTGGITFIGYGINMVFDKCKFTQADTKFPPMAAIQYLYRENPGPKPGSPYYNGFTLRNCRVEGNTYQYGIFWSQGWTGESPSTFGNRVVLDNTVITNNIINGAIQGQITPVNYAAILPVYFTKLDIIDSQITDNTVKRANADINLFSSQVLIIRSTLDNPNPTVDLNPNCDVIQLYKASGPNSQSQVITPNGCFPLAANGKTTQSPNPFASPSLVVCFPGSTASVMVKNKGRTLMKDVKLGDHVLVDNHDNKNVYEPIYSFGHYDPNVISSDYIQITTATEKNVLELSSHHMVFLKGNRAVPASMVQVGDEVMLGASATSTADVVHSIKKVTRQGAFAPFTSSGKIVVNGIQASTFVSFHPTSEYMTLGNGNSATSFSTGVSYQWIARTFEFPHRVYCRLFASACHKESYNPNGISTWVALPHSIMVWIFEQHFTIQIILCLPILSMMGVLGLMQSIVEINSMSMMMMTATSVLLLSGVLFFMTTTFRIKMASATSKKQE